MSLVQIVCNLFSLMFERISSRCQFGNRTQRCRSDQLKDPSTTKLHTLCANCVTSKCPFNNVHLNVYAWELISVKYCISRTKLHMHEQR